MVFENDFDQVTTFESFYKNVLNNNGNIIFPYINVGVSSHKLNPSNELQYLDRCYIVCIDAIIHKINENLICPIAEGEKLHKNVVYLGGVDIEKGIHTEIVIYCKKVYLETLDDSRLQGNFWIPIQTPNSSSNMNKDEVDAFFSNKFLPENLRLLVS